MPRGVDHLLRGVHAALAQCSWLLRWLPCHETYLMTRQEDPRTVPPPQSSCLRQESANAWFPLPPSALTCRLRDVGRGERLLPSRAVPCGDKSSSAVPAGRQTRHPLTVLMTAHVSAQCLLRRATPGAPGVDFYLAREGEILERSKPIKHRDAAFRFGALMEKGREQTGSGEHRP